VIATVNVATYNSPDTFIYIFSFFSMIKAS